MTDVEQFTLHDSIFQYGGRLTSVNELERNNHGLPR